MFFFLRSGDCYPTVVPTHTVETEGRGETVTKYHAPWGISSVAYALFPSKNEVGKGIVRSRRSFQLA